MVLTGDTRSSYRVRSCFVGFAGVWRANLWEFLQIRQVEPPIMLIHENYRVSALILSS